MSLDNYLKQFRQVVGRLESYGYALFQLIKENEGEEILELTEAKAYYDRFEKMQ